MDGDKLRTFSNSKEDQEKFKDEVSKIELNDFKLESFDYLNSISEPRKSSM